MKNLKMAKFQKTTHLSKTTLLLTDQNGNHPFANIYVSDNISRLLINAGGDFPIAGFGADVFDERSERM